MADASVDGLVMTDGLPDAVGYEHSGLLVIEVPYHLTQQQRSWAAAAYGSLGVRVLILDGGAKLARDYSEQLERIEAKLDALCEAMAQEDEGPEVGSVTTLDGGSSSLPKTDGGHL